MASQKTVPSIRQAAKSRNTVEHQHEAHLAPHQLQYLRSRLMNVEKALRSAAFLIDWTSDVGNKPLDGDLAFAVMVVLGHCETEVAEERAWITNEFMKPPVRGTAKSGRH